MIVPLSITTEKRTVGVLSPKEWLLLKDKLNDAYKLRIEFLLQTAMRISEAKYVTSHPECFREVNGAIFLPMVKGLGKDKCTIKNRQIMLSTMGIATVKEYINKKLKLPAYQNIEQVLKRAARDAGIDIKYITGKFARKSMISWLMSVYPERQSQIAFSSGHDYNTMRAHYLTYGWTKDDLRDMREYVKGWGEAQ